MSELLGQRIENYKILESIGVGGMGEVFKAIHETLDRVVALKVIHPELLSNADIIKRFYKEAKIQAQMTHPNIVTVFDFLEVQNSYFLVMEYIEGESIGRIIKKQGPQEINFSLNIFKQILSGISHAHSKGIIHRDIKPNNFILTGGEVKITDFGIAHIVSDSAHTVAGTVLGTPKYMSPEQILGEQVDHRSDVYSLGVSFYEILTGKVPFGSNTNSDYEIKRGHVELTPTPISEIRPDVSKDLEVAIARSMAKRPEARFQSVDDFLAGLKIGVSSDLSVNINTEDNTETTQPTIYTGETTTGNNMSFEDLDDYDENGEIEKRFFPQILCFFYRENKTGILYIQSDVELKVYFLQGNIVFSHGSNQRFALAELLVSKSIITKAEQQAAVAFANERDIKIGEALIKMGKISPHQLSTILEDQIRKRLMEGFGLTTGKFYYKDTNLLNLEVMYNINPLQVIYDAVQKSIIDDSHISDLLNADNTIIARRWGLAQDIATLKFQSTKELKLANSIKEANTIGDLIKISPLDEQGTRNFILFLHTAEFIDLKDKDWETEELEDIIITENYAASKSVDGVTDDKVIELEPDVLDDSQTGEDSQTGNVDSSEIRPDDEPIEDSSPSQSDFKIEINFPSIDEQNKQKQAGNEAHSSVDSKQANDVAEISLEDELAGDKTRVLSKEEIEQIRTEVSGSAQKYVSNGIENLDPGLSANEPGQGSSQVSSDLSKAGSDDIKLEIELPPLEDNSLNKAAGEAGQDISQPTISQPGNGSAGTGRKLSSEDTQELTQEDIEELRKLTLRKD
ncbi:MAG: serine/threonine protein kinase [Candidatus Dadabacteria bacterium]|nr:serine/threonine protein kinase [Candidatus Dadabacteria bacterium]NIS09553.1 serine/threonine protein kinase [Candidatus Dadabacteria bacterium]NIV43062.1 protein kinase [Candidatus Dadabacteria bacterium]NIX16027.1 protein kinase [Candidatus Dadabacteria bacterium]NIY22730.1 protein kinase [Candidatus Dadabacteria bacterium]